MDLSKSVFFDGKAMDVLKAIVRQQNVRPLTGEEAKLIKRADEILEVDKLLEGNLIRKLEEYRRFVPIVDAVNFLLEAKLRDLFSDAIDLLDLSVQHSTVLTSEELDQIFKELGEMPTDWLINMLAVDDNDRYAKPNIQSKKSSLNLDAMKNFK